MKKNFLITTGGSGGHVIPATILYDHLEKKANVIQLAPLIIAQMHYIMLMIILVYHLNLMILKYSIVIN